ncbi:hypothetical protein MRX96_048126 [Rhipicephalus microplus]
MTIALRQTLSYARRAAPTAPSTRIRALSIANLVTDLTQRWMQTALGVRNRQSARHGCVKPSKMNCGNCNPSDHTVRSKTAKTRYSRTPTKAEESRSKSRSKWRHKSKTHSKSRTRS